MNQTATQSNKPAADRGTSPPAVYAFVFVGTTGLIGLVTMIAAVAMA